MHRPDTPGVTVDNMFQNGNPGAGISSAILGAKYMNALLTEIETVIVGQGIVLSDQDATQLNAAILLLVAARVKALASDRVDFTSASSLTAGDGLLLVDLFGVVEDTVGSAGLPAVLIVLGIHTLPKLTTDVIAVGDRLYWDDGAGELTTTAAGNHLVGASVVVRGNGTTTVDVRLNGSAVAPS